MFRISFAALVLLAVFVSAAFAPAAPVGAFLLPTKGPIAPSPTRSATPMPTTTPMPCATSGLVLNPATLPDAYVDLDYSVQFTVTPPCNSAPYTFLMAGIMPAGLHFTSSGLLSGIPVSCGNHGCTKTLYFEGINSRGTSITQRYTLRIFP